MSAISTASQTAITGSGGVEEPRYSAGGGGGGTSGWVATAAAPPKPTVPLGVIMLKATQASLEGGPAVGADADAVVEVATSDSERTADATIWRERITKLLRFRTNLLLIGAKGDRRSSR